MSDRAEMFLTRWHRSVSERDLKALAGIVAEDVELGAPPYWGELRGRELVCHLLGLIIESIRGFHYRREWRDGDQLALEFFGQVRDLELQGIDLISLNDRGEIRRLDVLMRPVNAVIELREIIAPQMAEFISGRAEGAR